jgi:uncharacterized protein involved in cysteine biosynthesis
MTTALFKAFAQLGDPRLRRVLKIGVLAAIGSYLALILAASELIRHVQFFHDAWADTATGITLWLLSLLLPLPFFPALSTFTMSFMLDGVVAAVEERHYPRLNWPRPVSVTEMMLTSGRFLLVMVAANLLAAPAYVALLFFGLGLVLNYLLNGYLLGREYFELVALRRMEPDAARRLFRTHLGQLWLCGAIINLLFQVPLLNLAAPVIATAFMVHVFQRLRQPPSKV